MMEQAAPEPLILVNVMEEVIRDEITRVAKELKACTCNRCFYDACAMVLNVVKPKYATTTRGSLISKIPVIMKDGQVDLYFQCVQAVKFVMTNPRH